MQDLSIGDRCDNLGIAIHEMLHAVGFDHEQNRYSIKIHNISDISF